MPTVSKEEQMKEKTDPERSVRKLLSRLRKEINYASYGIIRDIYFVIVHGSWHGAPETLTIP